VPLVPQELGAITAHSPSLTPATLGTHLPRAMGEAQVWQTPAQSLSQQTPSTQKPLWHSPLVVQLWPGPDLPQLPPVQLLPAAHWLSAVQVRVHPPPRHREGAQEMGRPLTQVPAPSQLPGGNSWPSSTQRAS
jgi:hypothetical protein